MKNKIKAREQDPHIRNKNFEEVSYGYTLDEAIQEAARCLYCKHEPCREGCPVNVPIKEFIRYVKTGDIDEAYRTIIQDNWYPAICGRVCPQEKQCEVVCVRAIKGEPVGIGLLERFVGDNHHVEITADSIKKLNKKAAVIGSGPAGMACANDLALAGFDVTMFEALHELGGVLSYGIPEFRLPKDVLKKELANLETLGVKIEKNVVVGKTVTFQDLFDEGHKALFIATGAGLPKRLGLVNENMAGVFYANGFLTRVNLMKSYLYPLSHTPVKVGNNVAVIGAGNVAMDAARTAKRLGAENVYIVYRRSMAEVPARQEEVHHTLEEGITFKLLTNPVEILGDNHEVKGLRCEVMELGEPGSDGRRQPVKTGQFIDLDVDMVIIAIGQSSNPTIFEGNALDVNKWGNIIVNPDTLETNIENVYAGGDIVTGAATVILAMGAGRQAAKAIIEKHGHQSQTQ